jgi:hypothetical protein
LSRIYRSVKNQYEQSYLKNVSGIPRNIRNIVTTWEILPQNCNKTNGDTEKFSNHQSPHLVITHIFNYSLYFLFLTQKDERRSSCHPPGPVFRCVWKTGFSQVRVESNDCKIHKPAPRYTTKYSVFCSSKAL